MQTRNIAIMLTDIKGFTSKTASFSRAQTQELLTRHKELVLPVILRFHGRLVKTIGDAFLAAFDSPTDAVLCGVDIQQVLRDYNADKDQPQKIEIRIAINAGEVAIHDDGDIYGDPVNITSRLESIAEAGEVFFTEAVYLAMNKREVPSSEIGYRQFKGITDKIKVYRVLRETPVGAQPPDVTPGPRLEEPAQAAAARPAGALPLSAPPLRRLFALALDLVLFTLIFVVLKKTFAGGRGSGHGPLFFMGCWALYSAWTMRRFGGTAAMKVLRLKAVDSATGGDLPKGRAFRRAVFSLLSALCAGTGYLWALWDKDGLTWHDLIAGTRIIEDR